MPEEILANQTTLTLQYRLRLYYFITRVIFDHWLHSLHTSIIYISYKLFYRIITLQTVFAHFLDSTSKQTTAPKVQIALSVRPPLFTCINMPGLLCKSRARVPFVIHVVSTLMMIRCCCWWPSVVVVDVRSVGGLGMC